MRSILLVLALCGTIGFGLLAGPAQAQPPSGNRGDFDRLSGTWSRHIGGVGGRSMTLMVEPAGGTNLVWIDRAFCDEESLPPCDPPDVQTVAENSAEIAFHRVTGSTAYGNVISSTDPRPPWLSANRSG